MSDMAKGAAFSVRLSPATERLVTAEAARVHRSRSAIIESLTEEAARVRRFPGIGFRGDDFGRRPWVIGTNLDIWEICQMLDEMGSDEAVLDYLETLRPRHLQIAHAYWDAYPEEINTAIAGNRHTLEEWQELFPFVVVDRH